MDYTSRDIFDTANNFAEATRALNEKLSTTNDVGTYIAPIMTNASFSIELYMKCIFMIENGRPAPKIHELDKLFARLGDDSKAFIGLLYNKFVGGSPSVKALLENVPEVKIDLPSVLKEASRTFEKWRYRFQKNLTGFPTSGQLMDALRARIQMLKPEWF